MNFYLRSLAKKPSLTQWYGEQVVGLNTLRKVTGNLLKSVHLDGHFTNHSLRRSGMSRLFQSGVDPKLIREFTGHRSDALHDYEVTSDQQRQQMSNIIQGEVCSETKKNELKCKQDVSNDLEISVHNKSDAGCLGCSCNNQNVKLSETEKLGSVIEQILKSNKGGKAKIKIEIELNQ